MKRWAVLAAVACVGAAASVASAAALIHDDFQAGMGAWSSTSWTRVDVGGGEYMLQGTSGLATNPTKIPAAMQLDFDVQRTTTAVGSGPRIYFHSRTAGGLTSNKGYWISYLDDYNTDKDGIRITEKVADYGAETIIGVAKVTLDLNVHHVRLIDDGTGLFRLYFDDMTTPALVVDDSGSYSGGDNTYVGIGYTGRIDNIAVYGDDPPEAVTDLAAGNPDWFKLDLTWTAPTDYPLGPVAAYDIRYASDPITDANWDTAASCGCSPGIVAPGQSQTATARNLSAGTTYYFALKSRDAGGKWSALSNVAAGTTGPLDAVPPAAVADLAFANVMANRTTLSWTGTGDDGVTGQADRYDVRYAAEPLTEANWSTASQADAEPMPKAPGSVESWVLRGLLPETTYYVAIKVGDEVPNYSPISNVVTFTTPAADLVAPAAVVDLRLTGTHIKAAFLTWTAPLDTGGTACAEYDLRYSMSPIDPGNFAGATPVVGEPDPAAPGTRQSMTVSGLAPDTVYYFALKTADMAEPANVSDLSNVVSGRTMPPVAAVTARNPWIVNDRVADCRSLATLAATFDRQYTPDGVIVPNPVDIQQRAINSYNNFKRRWYHWGQMPAGNDDVVNQMNVFGWALCGSQAGMNAAILLQMGLQPRTLSIDNGGHTFYEVYYNNRWHALDTMTTYYVYDRTTPPQIASVADVKADKSLVLDAVAEGRACPGFLLCGDTPTYFANGSDTWKIKADPGNTATTKSMNMDLRMGESLTRTCESWTGQYYNHPTNTPPYHHEAARDWKDTVNLPYWEPYMLDATGNAAIGITGYSTTYRRWSNGTIVLAPDFRSAGYQAGLVNGTNLATFNDDSLTPDLHTAATGTLATAVYKIATPFYITDGYIDATFFRNAAGDINRLYVSPDGTTWTKLWENTGTGTTQLSQVSARAQVFGKYQMWVKVELQSTTAVSDAGLSNLVITAVFEHNKGGMAYLDKGVNHITVTFDNPQDFASGAALKVTYRWKENHGAGWTVDRMHEQYVLGSPFTYTITTGGTKVPRTESIVMEVTEPPLPDGSAPAPVTDLSVTGTDSTKVSLAWTATGDDWDSGTAAAYDLRYSMGPISEANWDAATPATGLPSPQVAGSAETFTAGGLQPSTTYYAALKVRDEGGNLSDLSNVVTFTTLPPDVTAPAWVGTLVGKRSKTAGGVDLAWTATGDDDGVGTATAYDLRYSIDPIDEINFSAATAVPGLPAPQPAGSSEVFTVTGLVGGQGYYFALKVVDDAGNVSEISNTAPATASMLGEKVLQDGLAGYSGASDNYMEASAPTTAYGDRERMRVCGYASTPTNRQRALVKFDLSGLPAGVQIVRATFSLYAYDEASRKGSTGFYAACPVTRNWAEIGSCWNKATSTVDWLAAGGDFEAAPDALSPKLGSVDVWYDFDVTARVQNWLDGTSTNYGWCIKVDDELRGNQDLFYSSDSVNADKRPKLVVTDLPAEVPGDIDQDGAVNVFDIFCIAEAWNTSLGERGFDPRCDLDGDGGVNIFDIFVIAENWGQ